MIGQEDFNFISRFDVPDVKTREAVIKENPLQLAKTFFNLLNHISKDNTIQYLLTLLDDLLQVQIYGKPHSENVYFFTALDVLFRLLRRTKAVWNCSKPTPARRTSLSGSTSSIC